MLASGLAQRFLTRLPIIVAVAFGVYSVALLGYTTYSWRQMKQDADAYLVADSLRRASAIGDLANTVRDKARVHANLAAVHAYLLNRDLGMSMRYGLGASLAAIDQSFLAHVAEDTYGRSSRIFYLAPDGVLLADTLPGLPIPALADASQAGPSMRIDARGGAIVTAARVDYKGVSGGTVVTVSSTRLLYRNLLPGKANNYREVLVTAEGKELANIGVTPLPPGLTAMLPSITSDRVLDVGTLPALGTARDSIENALVLKTQVPGMPLHLVTILQKEHAYGHIAPATLLVVAALVPVILLMGALRLERLRVEAERMKAEISFTEQQRSNAEQRNMELATEIWRREIVEKALAKSEERWELAIKGANDGIWDWNPQTGEVHLSERWKGMLGYAPEEIPNAFSEWESRVHPEDVGRVLAELNHHIEGKTEFYRTDYRMRHKDGRYIWVLDRGQALFDADGNVVRIAGSHSDITEQRNAEASAQERTEQLNAIFDLSPDGFVSFDSVARVSYVNPAFLGMTNLEDADVLGLNEAAFSDLLAGLCSRDARFRGVAALTREPAGQGRRELIEVLGTGRRVLEIGLRTGQGHHVSKILYFRDVTAETEVDQMKSEFLSTAAHELRTPMASIYGYSEVLMSYDFDEAERKTYLELIFRQSELMASIINELLDLARIEARRGKDFVFERLNLAEMVGDALRGFKPPNGRPASLLHVPEREYWVRADRTKMQQSINNVLSNAYKYSPAGGAVEIALVEGAEAGAGDRNEFGIEVRDHGIGMTPEQSARVCERFYRVDASGQIPGTGLGMSIVKEILDLHGGRLAISSQPGQGTTVTLWLQACQEESVA